MAPLPLPQPLLSSLLTRRQDPTSQYPDATSTGTLNKFPILALALAFGAFFLACLGVCCCSYHRRRAAREHRARVVTNQPRHQYRNLNQDADLGVGGDGLGLKNLSAPTHRVGGDGIGSASADEALPPYSPRAASFRAGRRGVPQLVISPSPALGVQGDEGQEEGSRLLASPLSGRGMTPPPTPPPPTYAGPALA